MKFLLALCLSISPQFGWPEENAFEGVPLRTLRAIPAIELTAADERPDAIRGTYQFTLIGDSRIAFLRWDSWAVDLVEIDTSGNVLREWPIAPRRRSMESEEFCSVLDWTDLAWLGGDRVLLLGTTYSSFECSWPWFVPPLPTLWVASLRAQTISPLGYGPRDRPRVVAATGNGGFVIGTNRQGESGLFAYDSKARLRWKHESADGLANLDDICVTPDSRIAVLDSEGGPGIQWIALDGRLGRYLKLEKIWHQVVGRPNGILAASDGGVRIRTWRDSMDIVSCTRDLEPLDSMSPRHADGQRLHGTWRVGAGGQLWFSDGYAFFLVGANGEIERVVGEPRNGRNLREADIVRIGPDDRIYAVASRDKFLHVFDASGNRIRVVPQGDHSEAGFPVFRGTSRELVDEESWPLLGSDRRWVCLDGVIRIDEPDGDPLFEFSAADLCGSPDGRVWWEGVAHDGRACVTTYPNSALRVLLLDPGGSVSFRWELPQHTLPYSVDFDGELFALSFTDQVVVFDKNATPRFRVSLEASGRRGGCGMEPDTGWRVHLAKHGTELWLRRGVTTTRIERYEMP